MTDELKMRGSLLTSEVTEFAAQGKLEECYESDANSRPGEEEVARVDYQPGCGWWRRRPRRRA